MFQQPLSPTRKPREATVPDDPVVLVVDDDALVREGLSELIMSIGLRAVCFASTQELLASGDLDRPGCLILDVRLPGSSGLDLQHRLTSGGNEKPIIFLTGHGDIPMTVQAMKAGAVDFLIKPVRDQALLDAITVGIERDRLQRETAEIAKRNGERVELLTPRELGVLAEVVRGRLNKQIAFDLNISEATVKLHRSNAMRKLEVSTVGALIRVWEALPEHQRRAMAR